MKKESQHLYSENFYNLGMNEIDSPNFEQLLQKGASSYDSQVGSWWLGRTIDQDHQDAYRNIAELLFARLKLDGKNPHFIVDYACGSGALFPHIQRLFPESVIIGIDGSFDLLSKLAHNNEDVELVKPQDAFQSQGKKVRLVHTGLPNFADFPAHLADALVLCFPNLLPDDQLLDVFNTYGYADEQDNEIATHLTRFEEMDPEHRLEEDKEQLFDELMTARVFARNFHHLLKPDAMMLKVEYSNAHRSELSDLTILRSQFMEGSLEDLIHEEEPEILFHYRESHYTPSPVILDVYHQTQDPGDSVGGYCVHFFNRESHVNA